MRIPKIPLIKRYELVADPDGEAYVEFRQARRGEEDKRQEMIDDMTWMFDEAGGFGGLKQNQNKTSITRLEVFMTLCGCNLVFEEDGGKDPEPVFKFKDDRGVPRLAMSQVEFERVWAMLPPELADEIVDHCHKHNPQWYQGEF